MSAQDKVGRGLRPRRMRDSGVEWLGAMPDAWGVLCLSQQVSLVKNKNDGLAETNLLSLSYGKIKRRNIDAVGGLLPASFEGYNRVQTNDIVLRLTDLQNDQHSLRTGLVKEYGIITSAYVSVRPSETTCAAYLHLALYAFDVAKGFYGMGSGVRQGLTYSDVKLLKLPVPPLSEQQKIAAYLDEKCAKIDEMVVEAKETIEEYKKWKASVIFEAVTGKMEVEKRGGGGDRKMRDSGVAWLPRIPKEWRIYPLKRYFEYFKGLNITKADLTEKGVPVISYGQIHSKSNTGTHLSDDLLRYVPKDYLRTDPEAKLQIHDFVFADTSEDLEGLGACAYVDRNDDIMAGYHTIVLRPREATSCKFLAYLFRSDCWRTQVRQSAYGIKVYSLSQRILNQCSIVLPPIEEQGHIVSILDEKCAAIDRVIAEKEALIADLEAYKKSLIFEVVTGKREVV